MDKAQERLTTLEILRRRRERICELMNIGAWRGTEAEAVALIEALREEARKIEEGDE